LRITGKSQGEDLINKKGQGTWGKFTAAIKGGAQAAKSIGSGAAEIGRAHV
jgi:hypothetical protein